MTNKNWLFFCLILFLLVLINSSFMHGNNAVLKLGKYKDLILDCSKKYNVPAGLIHSLISVESNYNPFAVSSKGAVGLMQLMPETAKHYGVKNPYDPGENIEGGVKYLKDLIKKFNGETNLVLAAYNAGVEAIKKYNGVPPFPETQRFIRKVRNIYHRSTILPSKIYHFYDSSGRLVITNNPRLISIHSKLPTSSVEE